MELTNLTADYGNHSIVVIGPSAPHTLDLVQTTAVQVIFYIIYSIIFTVGVLGNVLVMYAVVRNRTMRTVTNYFIVNLALADILLCILCVPFTPLYTFIGHWVFGKVLCHLVTCTQGISIYISSLTLTMIAFDRFYAIMYPYSPRMTSSTCYILILCTWLVSIVATLPYAYFVRHLEVNRQTYLCQEHFPKSMRIIYGGITSMLQFVIPFAIMTVAYTMISLNLSRRDRNRPGTRSAHQEQADRQRTRRTNRMLIAMVAVFGTAWLPLNLLNLLDDISTSIELTWHHWEFFHLLFFVAHAIAMSSTCYNPLLYAWLNSSFRKEFKEILPCIDSRQNEQQGKRSSENAMFVRANNANPTQALVAVEDEARGRTPTLIGEEENAIVLHTCATTSSQQHDDDNTSSHKTIYCTTAL